MQVDLDALDRMVAEAEAAPILWTSRAAFLWNAYPALAAELREARQEIRRLQQAYAASVQEVAAKSRELHEAGSRIANQRKELGRLEERDRRMKRLGAVEVLKAIAAPYGGDATGCNPQVLLDELIKRAAELEAAGEGEGNV